LESEFLIGPSRGIVNRPGVTVISASAKDPTMMTGGMLLFKADWIKAGGKMT
jgi:hypothetical protein